MADVPKEPGIYPGLTFDQYAQIPAINFTKLSRFRDTAAHARHAMLNQPESTPTQHLGQLIHLAILEPKRFDAEVVIAPKLDRRTTAGKAAWESFVLTSKGREIATADEWEVCRGLQHSVSQHATAREILRGRGAAELTIVWLDEEHGCLCKSRLDWVGELGTESLILDVKSSGDVASLRNFQRSIGNYGYAEQAAMYVDGLRTLRPLGEQAERKFIWLVAEKEPPYLVRLFEIEYDALQYGHTEYRKHLAEYAECVKSGNWPGYPDGVDVAGLPAWMAKTYDSTL